MPAFLNPAKPLVTCTRESCENCPAGKLVHCHFGSRDLAHYLWNGLPPFMLGGVAITRVGWWWLVPWLVVILGYFGLLEIRVMCSHCPHYAEEGSYLKCWANYGFPKLWRFRPGPMSGWETFWFYTGLVVVLGYPLVYLLLGMRWFLLAVYVLTAIGAAVTLQMSFCSQCINFACPLNCVSKDAQEVFFEHNPTIAQAWRMPQ